MTIQDTLNDREERYGDFAQLACAIQSFKDVYRKAPGWAKMSAVQREAMDMDLVKTCRILYGDPTHADSWADKCGYAMLAHEEFTRPPVQTERRPIEESLPMPSFLTKSRT